KIASDAITQEDDPSIEWHPSADNPTVHYVIPYKNASSTETVECLIQVSVGLVPRDRNAPRTWREVSKNTHHFILPPKQETTLQGTLIWMPSSMSMPASTLMPQIRYPDPIIDKRPAYYRC